MLTVTGCMLFWIKGSKIKTKCRAQTDCCSDSTSNVAKNVLIPANTCLALQLRDAVQLGHIIVKFSSVASMTISPADSAEAKTQHSNFF